MLRINYAYTWSCDYRIIHATLTFAIELWTCYPLLKAKYSQTNVIYLSLMSPWLYLLSTICAHSCNFPTTQVMQVIMFGMRIIAMSIRLEVNQSMLSLCEASVESVVYILLSFLYKTMRFIIVPLCNKHCNGTFEICLLMCATVSGAHMSLLCILFCS